VAPGFEPGVLAVARRLGFELAVRHRAEVQLDEAEQPPTVGLGDVDTGVGGNRPLLAGVGGERLAGVGLAVEGGEPDALWQPGLQHHVQLAKASGVSEEQRVRLAPLAAARRRFAFGDRLALPRRPQMMRR
jgi:hypothetical protein